MLSTYVEGDGQKIYIYNHQPLQRINIKFSHVAEFVRQYHDQDFHCRDENLNLPSIDGTFILATNDTNFSNILSGDRWQWLKNNVFGLGQHLNTTQLITRNLISSDSPMMVKSAVLDEIVVKGPESLDIYAIAERCKAMSIKIVSPNGDDDEAMELAVSLPTIKKPSTPQTTKNIIIDNIKPFQQAIKFGYEKRFSTLETRYENTKKIALKEGFKMAMKYVNEGWCIVEKNGREYFNYPGRINATEIHTGGVIYDIPKPLIGEIWVDDLHVPMDETIGACQGRGFNCHLQNNSHAGYPTALEELNGMCIGDLSGRPISDVGLFVEMYKTCNMDSNYSNYAVKCCDTLLGSQTAITPDMTLDNGWLKNKMLKFLQFRGKASKQGRINTLEQKNRRLRADDADGEVFTT